MADSSVLVFSFVRVFVIALAPNQRPLAWCRPSPLQLCVLAREASEVASRKGATSRRHAHNDLGDGAGVYLCIQNACRDDGVTDREEVGDQQ